jgi:hypothetical protein
LLFLVAPARAAESSFDWKCSTPQAEGRLPAALETAREDLARHGERHAEDKHLNLTASRPPPLRAFDFLCNQKDM